MGRHAIFLRAHYHSGQSSLTKLHSKVKKWNSKSIFTLCAQPQLLLALSISRFLHAPTGGGPPSRHLWNKHGTHLAASWHTFFFCLLTTYFRGPPLTARLRHHPSKWAFSCYYSIHIQPRTIRNLLGLTHAKRLYKILDLPKNRVGHTHSVHSLTTALYVQLGTFILGQFAFYVVIWGVFDPLKVVKVLGVQSNKQGLCSL